MDGHEHSEVDDAELFQRLNDLYCSVAASSSPTTMEPEVTTSTPPPLGKRRRTPWTLELDRRISEALLKHGVKWRTIARELNIGSDDAVRNRVSRFKVDELAEDVKEMVKTLQARRVRGKRVVCKKSDEPLHTPWRPEEDEYIKSELINGRRGAWQRLYKGLLSHRSVHAIRNRASRIHLI